jgi:hypothetical protein
MNAANVLDRIARDRDHGSKVLILLKSTWRDTPSDVTQEPLEDNENLNS